MQRGDRDRERGGANVWILSPDFQSVVFCSQRGSITVTHRLRPIPNTAVFLAGRHRAEPRNWISAPCDTSPWPLELGFIMEINRLLLGTRVLCLSGQSYLSTKGGREKEGLPNGSHSLPLAGKEERLNWKTQLAKWPQQGGYPSNP